MLSSKLESTMQHSEESSACRQQLVRNPRKPKVASGLHVACGGRYDHLPQNPQKESTLAQAASRIAMIKVTQGKCPATHPQHIPRESRVGQLASSEKGNAENQPSYPQRMLVDLSRTGSSVGPDSVARRKKPAVHPQHTSTVGIALSKGLAHRPQHVVGPSKPIKGPGFPMTITTRGRHSVVTHQLRPKRPQPVSLLAMTLLLYKVCGALAGRMVVDPYVTAVWGKNVTLRCILEVNENITQISWEKVIGKIARSIAVHHPVYGISILEGYLGRASFKSQSIHDASIVINNIDFSDSGQFICKAATFPLGNTQLRTNLTVIVEPTVSLLKGPYPLIDEGNMTLAATCIAANGKPVADVHWEGDLGRAELKTSSSFNGTVTVMSQYKLIPTRFAQGRTITCVVSHPALEKKVRYPYVLDIQYAPEVSVTVHDGKWFLGSQNLELKCNADANPPPTKFTWSRLDGEWPEGLRPLNSSLLFSFLTHNHSGIYVCKVTNELGERSGQRSIRILDPPTTPTVHPTVPLPHLTTSFAPTTLSGKGESPASILEITIKDNLGTIIASAVCGALLVVLVIVVAGVVCIRRRQTFRGDYFTKSYTPPSGMQKESQVDVLQTVILDSYPETATKDQHPVGNIIRNEHTGSMQKPHWNNVDTYNSRYEEMFERPIGYYDGIKTPISTKSLHEDGYDDNEDDFVSHVDGSVISRKEWYV